MNNKISAYIQTFIGKVFVFILFIFMIFGKTEAVFASEEKISNELKECMEKASEDKLLTIWIIFDNKIDTASIQPLTADADTYEERVDIITAIYKDTIDTFMKTYLGEDKSRIFKTSYDQGYIEMDAKKEKILLYAQDEKVLYIDVVGTSEQWQESGSVLIEAKAAAIANLLGYVELSDYRIEQQEEIRGIINAAIVEIDNLESKESICIAVVDVEEELAAVKTEEELILEENEKQESNLKEPVISPSLPEEEETIPQNPQTEQTEEAPMENVSELKDSQNEAITSESEKIKKDYGEILPEPMAEVSGSDTEESEPEVSEDDSDVREPVPQESTEPVMESEVSKEETLVKETVSQNDKPEKIAFVVAAVIGGLWLGYYIRRCVLRKKGVQID